MATRSEENFNKQLGFRLMRLRQEQRMSQENLGVKLGVRYQQIQKYELGVSRIPPEKIVICAHLFDVSTEYILHGDQIDKQSGHSKSTLIVAEEISKLPTIELKRTVFQIAKEINNYSEIERNEENIDQKYA